MSSEEETDLVARAQAGDMEAFRTLVRDHHRRVFHVCLGVVKSAADAEDVTQEVFIRAHKNLTKFQGNAKFSTWLYRIAHNASIDLLRKRKRREADDFDDVVDTHKESSFDENFMRPSLGFDPRDGVRRQEMREGITAAFESLSAAHREILILREVEDLSYQEIADTLGIKLGTVMSRLYHARNNAQAHLKEHFPELVENMGNAE